MKREVIREHSITYDQDFKYSVMEQKLYTSINEFIKYLNCDRMINKRESVFYIPDETEDRSGNYKYEVGDDVVFLNYDYSSSRGKILELTKHGMNNQLWNHYLIELSDGKTKIVDESDIFKVDESNIFKVIDQTQDKT